MAEENHHILNTLKSATVEVSGLVTISLQFDTVISTPK